MTEFVLVIKNVVTRDHIIADGSAETQVNELGIVFYEPILNALNGYPKDNETNRRLEKDSGFMIGYVFFFDKEALETTDFSNKVRTVENPGINTKIWWCIRPISTVFQSPNLIRLSFANLAGYKQNKTKSELGTI